MPLNFTKSINLAISERGIHALRNSGCPGLLDSVLADSIPMHGRMIHSKDSNGDATEEAQAYDVHGEAIRAVDRGGLNKHLLDVLESMPNVTLFFNHKLTGADFQHNAAWFEVQKNISDNPRPIEIEVHFDFLIGADGAHSATRYHLMKFVRMSYQQTYIDTLWCEFRIPPRPEGEGGGWRLSEGHLHIWPGKRFMFIAIPSLDRSFTCTLFLPSGQFSHLSLNPTLVEPFFKQHFPGVTPSLISPSALRQQFEKNPHLPLISIKCTPYHHAASCIILGDAAHAMVPFYGQGMNAGLEDVRVLFEQFLDTTGSTEPVARASALGAYTKHRHPDLLAINDLAMQNYDEMSAGVTSRLYLFRKWVEESVSLYLPALGWQTQYVRVSFGNERYSEVVERVAWQGMVLRSVVWGLGGMVGLGTAWTIWRRQGQTSWEKELSGRWLRHLGGIGNWNAKSMIV
ncbi:MAG: kynurenine 3-monooxygenase, mitochondrial precursor [Geoglossum simile]|nr:MAG: kynurenine 3-monooxygenase, mitochondrial precursor [Geoglossum simile]